DYEDADEKTQPAVKWMLDTLALGLRQYYGTVLIRNPEVLRWYGLSPRRDGRYSVKAIEAVLGEKKAEFQSIAGKFRGGGQLTLEEKGILLAAMQAAQRTELIDKMDRHLDKHRDPDVPKLFRIENDQVLAMLGLQARRGLRYSLEEIRGD